MGRIIFRPVAPFDEPIPEESKGVSPLALFRSKYAGWLVDLSAAIANTKHEMFGQCKKVHNLTGRCIRDQTKRR